MEPGYFRCYRLAFKLKSNFYKRCEICESWFKCKCAFNQNTYNLLSLYYNEFSMCLLSVVLLDTFPPPEKHVFRRKRRPLKYNCLWDKMTTWYITIKAPFLVGFGYQEVLWNSSWVFYCIVVDGTNFICRRGSCYLSECGSIDSYHWRRRTTSRWISISVE